MVAAADQGELAEAVKNAQRTSAEMKEAWHRYCDSYGGRGRDPSRQSAAFLRSFLAAGSNPQALLPGKAPVSAVASFSHLAQQVKDHQRSSPEARDTWHGYCDEQGGGIRDPMRHSAAYLQAYLQSVGVVPRAQGTDAQAPRTDLVEKVKAAQRASEANRGAWHDFCDGQGGVRDPAKHDAEMLEAFLATIETEAPSTRPPPWGAPSAPLASTLARAEMPHEQAHRAELVERVKVAQRASEAIRGAWHDFCDSQGGVRDPARHSAETLEAFLLTVETEAPPARPPPWGASSAPLVPAMTEMPHEQAHRAELVERVKVAQRASEAIRAAWHDFCDGQGGVRDPARHDAGTLEAFLATVETEAPPARPPPRGPPSAPRLPPAPAEISQEHAELVMGVKSLQKSSEEMRMAWHTFCDNKGPGHRDPARHPPEFLEEFVALSAQGAEAVIAAFGGAPEDALEAESLEELADRVKRAQRSSTSLKELWHFTCDQEGGGVRDPQKHDAEFLRNFLWRLPGDQNAVAGWGASDDSAPWPKRLRHT